MKIFFVAALSASLISSISLAQDELKPKFEGKDLKRKQLKIKLVPFASGFEQITDVQFEPDRADRVWVAQKEGKLVLHDTKTGTKTTLLNLKVRTQIEQGLLGIAFHPKFEENRKFYINYNPASTPDRTTWISEWTLDESNPTEPKAINERKLLEVAQPYANHKAGQLAFGPADGYLYIGLGDGGSGGDPDDNGQNRKTLLGKILRVDVDRAEGGKPYAIPKENPFTGNSNTSPEVWAYGVRNPWRYSFDPKNRLIVADVGQNKFEEVSIVPAGSNMGWRLKEASHCFEPKRNCVPANIKVVDPILEYGRDEGQSVTGGYVLSSEKIPELKGKYIYGDFVQGRIWAADIDVAESGKPLPPSAITALGKWPISLSTFGRDANGDVYAADFGQGVIYRLAK